MSAMPIGKAPVATLGIASRLPWPAEISTSRPASSKWPLSIARKKGAAGPSNFQSRAKGISVVWACAPAAARASVAAAKVALIIGASPSGSSGAARCPAGAGHGRAGRARSRGVPKS